MPPPRRTVWAMPVTCPQCGGDDISRAGAADGEAIALRCDTCGSEWSREPKLVCNRCASEDIEIGGYEGWAYDDIEEARDDPSGGSWAYMDREVFRCRKC